MSPRQQLLKLKEQTGITPPILDDEPELDLVESQFLDLFWKITNQSTTDNILNITQLNSWSAAYQHPFSPIELDYIFMLSTTVSAALRSNKE